MNCPGCGAAMRLEEAKDCLTCDFCGYVHFPEPNADGVRVLEERAGMACPVCKTPLVHAGILGVRLVYCEHCRGLLIRADVLYPLVQQIRAERESPEIVQSTADLADLKRTILCPRCGQPMDSHPYAGPGNIVIDNCPGCELNWLDHGELRRIASAPDRTYEEG